MTAPTHNLAIAYLKSQLPNIPTQALIELLDEIIKFLCPSIKNKNLLALAEMLIDFLKGNLHLYFNEELKMTIDKLSYQKLYWMLFVKFSDRFKFIKSMMTAKDLLPFSKEVTFDFPYTKFDTATGIFKKEDNDLGVRFVEFYNMLEKAFVSNLKGAFSFSKRPYTPVGIFKRRDVVTITDSSGGYVDLNISLVDSFLTNLNAAFPSIPIEVLVEILTTQRLLLLSDCYSNLESWRSESKDAIKRYEEVLSLINIATEEEMKIASKGYEGCTQFLLNWYLRSNYDSCIESDLVKNIKSVRIEEDYGHYRFAVLKVDDEIEKINTLFNNVPRSDTISRSEVRLVGKKVLIFFHLKNDEGIHVREYRFANESLSEHFYYSIC